MEILNLTPFTFANIVGRVGFPKYSLTFIVKGTFELEINKSVSIVDKQFYPTGDEFYPEDEDMIGGPRYASDFAYFKPKADLLLAGKCHSTQGKKVYSSNVKFQVGAKSKTLNVFGNRYWVGGFSNNIPTNPEPFSEMELRYENSYGGKGYERNPVGKGIDKVEIKTGDNLIPLPNILHFGEKISSKSTKLEPAGFGPLGQMWPQRYSKIGTYKGDYLKERWPWFARDFDWGYFNTAPPDMQISGYLRGDEKLYFENLHPVNSQYHSQLPGIRVRCFINEFEGKKTNNIDPKFFKEVKMNLDTLWVNMENEKLVLVWRGVSEIKTEEYDEIKNTLIVSENIAEQPHSIEYYRDQLEKGLVESEEEVTIPEPADEEDSEMEAEIAKAEEQMRASLIEGGFDPDNLPEQSEEDKKKEAELIKEMGFEEEETPLTREIFIERANKKESFEGEDLRGIDLSGLDLQDLNFQDTVFSGVSLKNSNLSNSNLTGANLTGTDLTNAKLNGALVKEADFNESILADSDLTGADLEETIFEKANLKKAILKNVKGKNSFFSEADLTGASLMQSEFNGADFSKSILDNSNFQDSVLNEASLENSSCKQTNFSGSDLTKLRASGGDFTKALFIKSSGAEITWGDAVLTEADFSYSDMESANFTSANLEKTNLFAANMKFARFAKANLNGAILKQMNLFQGSMEKADLTRADCSGSNFYGVEFLDSVIKDTRFQLTNLKMTKLSKR